MRPSEGVAFWALALLHLVPVWAFPYLPTQDGPAHLNNAQILKEYGHSAAGYEAFFELRDEPLPNLTSHLLLAGLLYLFPPLVAEKVVVSLYVLGFAGSFRYFLGAFGPRCRPLSWGGLLLVYNRCFWMGFWNYCLSLILLWVILGYCLRRRGTLHLPHALALLPLFVAEYLTHLVGFLLAWAGAFAATLLVSPRRILPPILIVLVGLSPACLAMYYFARTGFFQSRSAMSIVRDPLARLSGGKTSSDLGQDLSAIDDELLAHHTGSAVPGGVALLAYLGMLTVLTVVDSLAAGRSSDWSGDEKDELDNRPTSLDPTPGPGRLFPAGFGLLLLGAYLLLPNHLGLEHGGFLKARLALLPPLLWLACLREPALPEARLLVRGLTALLIAGNLFLVTDTVRIGNREVEQYTAGVEAVGRGHRLFVIQSNPKATPLVNPLLHAADYYCLGTENVNLDNYEAGTPHFPVTYRRGVTRGRDHWAAYPQQDVVDVVLCWQPSPNAKPGGPAGWDEIVAEGPLRIYRRPPGRQ
ncbi:MAG TPA: hypothetical protein VKA46_38280 [Gemmataceae bacterium]|nr:hypothetical protein [Gemmataceae bacterium]